MVLVKTVASLYTFSDNSTLGRSYFLTFAVSAPNVWRGVSAGELVSLLSVTWIEPPSLPDGAPPPRLLILTHIQRPLCTLIFLKDTLAHRVILSQDSGDDDFPCEDLVLPPLQSFPAHRSRVSPAAPAIAIAYTLITPHDYTF